ncbi:MAG: TIGR03668 family PPOX class F420-dependent oxidoreductase [Acidimicrobiia bacterium]|nr:TIGR03668 family PPOX class F420-dependent oxidoreductase [Acidimicrobiia bacterium]
MRPAEARSLFASSKVAVLSTINEDGTPHLVPITFAVTSAAILTAVDEKPKSTTALRRLANIARDPRVTLLADAYDDDWSKLWWARADGLAAITTEPPAGLTELVARYSQYQDRPPPGPFIEIAVHRWSGWSP